MEQHSDDLSISLTKFDVAERQLLQAIRMFFAQEDSVSIHTLSESAGQVLHDIGKCKGVTSLSRDYDRIRPERKKEWLAAVFKSRNFFKHADKDAEATHEFKDVFNDFSLLDAVNMHCALKKQWTPETLLFMVWFGLQHPNIVRENTEFHNTLNYIQSRDSQADPRNKAFVSRALLTLRSGRLSAPNITLAYGLLNDA